MDFSFPNRNHIGPVLPLEGLEIEWLDDGKIISFTLTSPTRDLVETYFQARYLHMDLANETPNIPVLMINDLSSTEMTLTPLLRSRMNELAKRIRSEPVHYYSAMVMPKSISGQVFKLAGNVLSRTVRDSILKFFTDRDQAMHWLRNLDVNESIP